MKKLYSRMVVLVTVALLNICNSTISYVQADSDYIDRHDITISGQVTDSAGQPLSGVTVSAHDSAATSNHNGFFVISIVNKSSHLAIRFTKHGYQPVTEVLFFGKKFGYARKKSSKKEDTYDREDHHLPVTEYTLTKVLQPVGVTVQVDPALGGTVSSHGVKLTFPPGSIRAEGPIDVTITFFDPADSSLDSIPGVTTTSRHRHSLTEFLSVAKIDLSQNSRPIKLNEENTVTVELPLATETALAIGETVKIKTQRKYFPAWRHIGHGVVIQSSAATDRLAVSANLRQLGWISAVSHHHHKSCLSGTVKTTDGMPVAGAEVLVSGENYNGLSRTHTDYEGHYRVFVKSDALATIKANALVTGNLLHSQHLTLSTPQESHRSCSSTPDLVLGEQACVSGIVRDSSGNPLGEGVVVNASSGASAITDISGRYCLSVPANTDIAVTALDYPAVTVNAPTGSTCSNGDCVLVDLAPAQGPGPDPNETTCVSGSLFHLFGFPLPNASLQAFDTTNQPVGNLALTDGSGMFTLTSVPTFTDILITGGDSTCSASGYYNSGPAGHPDNGSCLQIGGLTCQ